MSRYTELEAEQQATRDWVAAEGVDLVLSRPPAAESDGAGGFTRYGEPTPLPARRRHVQGVSATARGGATEYVQDDEGTRYEVRYVLVGTPGDDVQRGDVFTFQGQQLRVWDVAPDRRFQVRARCVLVAGGG